MNNNNTDGNRKARIQKILLATMAALVAIYGVFTLIWRINDQRVPQNGGNLETVQPVEKNPDSIAIPGYELLELQANSTTQNLCLSNPEENVCYFQISLHLEDGTLLWQSDLIAPGEASKAITLTKPLDKGTYSNAILKYNCFELDGITPLNGAETKLTLWVK